MDKVSMPHLISFSRYQTKYVMKFLFRQLMTLTFFLDQRLKQWLTENTKIQKFKYFKIEKSFLDEMKNIFHSF